LKAFAKRLLTAAPLVLLIAAMGWAICLYRFHTPLPPIGTYVATLAFLAAVVTIWPPEGRWPKAGWVILFGALLGFEVHNLYRDRAQHDREQNDARKREDDRFAEILQNDQSEFKATMDKSRQLLSMTQESLNNITGGDSFPYVVPQTHARVDPVPLFMWDHGRYILTGVSVVIRNTKAYGEGDAAFLSAPEFSVGVVHPGWGKLLRQGISPKPDASGIDSYEIEMYTQSDFFTEVLRFRKGKYALPWAYQYWVVKHLFGESARRMMPKAARPPHGSNVGMSVPVLNTSGWSDDQGDGKPVVVQP
jgi:uncharacterized membrane protein